jgi:hypothetical protein
MERTGTSRSCPSDQLVIAAQGGSASGAGCDAAAGRHLRLRLARMMTSVDWPTRSATRPDRRVGPQRGRMGARQHAADLGGRSRDDQCGERPGGAPTDTPADPELQGRLLWLGSGLAGSHARSPRPLARRPIRGGRTRRARRARLPWPWPGIVGCRTSPRRRSTRGGSKTTLASPGAPATSARPRTPSPSAARQPTWPR